MAQIYRYDRENKRLTLDFHPGQSRVWESKRRFVLMLAGTQSGKTSFGPWWLRNEMETTTVPEGGNDYLAITTSFPLFSLKMLPEIRRVYERILGIGRYWPSAHVMELREGLQRTGRFWAKSADDLMWGRIILLSVGSPARLEAATAKAAWLDELGQPEWDVTDWEAVLRRLSLAQGRVLGTTTPYNAGWLKTEWYDRFMDGDLDYDVIQFASTLNPAFPSKEFEAAKRRMEAWRFKMFYRGLFARPAGLIYNAFTDEMLCDRFEIPTIWERIVGLDFGGANTSVIKMALSPGGELFVYGEYLGGGISTPEHAARVKEEDEEPRKHGLVRYVGGAPSETQSRMDWQAEKVDVLQPPIADVEGGISRVISAMKMGRFFVMRDMKGVLHEIETYSRKLDDRSQPTDEIQDKRKYHRLDAIRYGVALATDETAGVWTW